MSLGPGVHACAGSGTGPAENDRKGREGQALGGSGHQPHCLCPRDLVLGKLSAGWSELLRAPARSLLLPPNSAVRTNPPSSRALALAAKDAGKVSFCISCIPMAVDSGTEATGGRGLKDDSGA